MAYQPEPIDADTVDGKHASDLLKQVVQPSAPAGDINTRWVNSTTGVEYRWDSVGGTWVAIGSGAVAHSALTGLANDDHTQYAPIQVINAGDTPSTTYQRNGSLVVRRNTDTGTGLGFLPLQGGAMTGALSLYGAPSSSLHAATKAYVDFPYWFGTYAGGISATSSNSTTIPFTVSSSSAAAGDTWTVTGGVVTLPYTGVYVISVVAGFYTAPWVTAGTVVRAFLNVLPSTQSDKQIRSSFGFAEDRSTATGSIYLTAGTTIAPALWHNGAANNVATSMMTITCIRR